MTQTNFLPDRQPHGPAEQSAELASLNLVAQIIQQRLRPAELAQGSDHSESWFVHGYIGPGKLTLLTSQWKSGKTTLLSILLAKMALGGELAGLPVAATKAAIFTEESREDWDVRNARLPMHPELSLFCRPFPATPTRADWRALVDAALQLRREEGVELLAIDPLTFFLPGHNDFSTGPVLSCLVALRELTARGMGVVVTLHPRKGSCLLGQWSRGGGPVLGHFDVQIEMHRCGKPDDTTDRRRWLRAWSRSLDTQQNLVLELTADSTDYRAVDTLHDTGWTESWTVLLLVLEEANERLTQREILEQWPEDFCKPDPATLSRTLNRALEQELVRRVGTGRRNAPFRYWLPSREDYFYPGENASPEKLARWRQLWVEYATRVCRLESPSERPAAEAVVEPLQTLPQPTDVDLAAIQQCQPLPQGSAGEADVGPRPEHDQTKPRAPLDQPAPVPGGAPAQPTPPPVERPANESEVSQVEGPAQPTPAPMVSSPAAPSPGPVPPRESENARYLLLREQMRRSRRWPHV
jgi:hypothetical protein